MDAARVLNDKMRELKSLQEQICKFSLEPLNCAKYSTKPAYLKAVEISLEEEKSNVSH